MICFFILIPLLVLLILNLPPKRLMQRLIFWVGCLLCIVQMAVAIFPAQRVWSIDITSLVPYLRFDVTMDSLSQLLLLCIGLVVLVVFITGRHLITEQNQRFNFMNLLIIMLTGMNGIVLVRDIFSLYVFLEIIAVTSFILISLQKRRDAFEAAFQYIILSVVATMLILISVALIILISGSASFTTIKIALQASPHSFLIVFAIGLFLCGLFIKGGLVPFHGWLADAYSAAPAPVSVLLAGIVTKTVGAYALMRVVASLFIFNNPVENILLVIGTISILVGAIEAFAQNDFKRMLAYSSISQVGYIILSLGCGTPLGFAAAAFHIFNHAVSKSLLFVNAASVESQLGTTNMDKMGGLASKMPFTGVTSVLGALSTAGVPPLSGFWSKFLIVLALWLSGHFVYAIIAILASVLTLGYMLVMQRRIFFGKLAGGLDNVKEVSRGLLIVTFILSAIVVGAGLFFPFILNKIILPIGGIVK